MTLSEQEATICNSKGLHARAAAEVVNLSCQYRSILTFHAGEQEAKCNSLIQLLMLAATKGTRIRVKAEGEDATSATSAMVQLIEGRFNEDD